MGKLIIDGNSFFEIDEECIKKKRISKKCGLDKYLKEENYEKFISIEMGKQENTDVIEHLIQYISEVFCD